MKLEMQPKSKTETLREAANVLQATGNVEMASSLLRMATEIEEAKPVGHFDESRGRLVLSPDAPLLRHEELVYLAAGTQPKPMPTTPAACQKRIQELQQEINSLVRRIVGW